MSLADWFDAITALRRTAPTQTQKSALSGTVGIPSGDNRYVTDDDPRLASVQTLPVLSADPAVLPNDVAWFARPGTSPDTITVRASIDEVLYEFDLGGTSPVGSDSVVVQYVDANTTGVATGTTTIPGDDTIPQKTEGTEFLTVSITPQDAANILHVEGVLMLSPSIAVGMIVALFQDTANNALEASLAYVSTNGGFAMVPIVHRMVAGTTASTTFKLRAGPYLAATVTLNGQAGGRLLGGVACSRLRVTELLP